MYIVTCVSQDIRLEFFLLGDVVLLQLTEGRAGSQKESAINVEFADDVRATLQETYHEPPHRVTSVYFFHAVRA